MLTPIEIHNAEHKTGRGYSKREMDEFLDSVSESYETLYKENMELKNKLSKLTNEIEYYKSMETTLQKALVLAEKTSKDTIDTARKEAGVIEKQASIKAEKIVNQAWVQYDATRQKCIQLIQQYNQFKMQFKQIAIKQIDLLESDFYEIYSSDLTASLNEAIDKADTEPEPQAKPEEAVSESASGSKADTIKEEEKSEIPEVLYKEEEAAPVVSEEPEKDAASDISEEPEKAPVSDISKETEKEPAPDTSVQTEKEPEPAMPEKKADETIRIKEKVPPEEEKEDSDIPPVDMESIDSLLRDIRQDFANRQEEQNKSGNKFEFLDNE